MALARTQYVRSGNADIAYQVIGAGQHDIVLAFDFASHLEEVSEHPQMREFLGGLERIARVLLFDMRGIGMSGGIASASAALESWMDDVVAVLDAAGSRRATFVAQGHASQMALLTAAAYPDRVASLVLVNGWGALRSCRRLSRRAAVRGPRANPPRDRAAMGDGCRTVRDLVAGSGIAFEERGEHELKGVPDTWALDVAVG